MNQPAAAAPALPPAPEGMINVIVDGALVHVRKGATVMDACNVAAKEIPHFCYHKRLSIAGNCRMCLVEVEGMPKPIASCHWPAAEGMRVKTASPIATDARKSTMEFLLINHPLDCPICDQGGECTLQDLSVGYGGDRTHFHEMKRAVDDKEIGHKIKTVMTRCIHCTRCIRFATEIAGVQEFGATGRGENMQVGTYVEQALQSELAGNMIDLCPVGALTNKPYAFTARPWELVTTPAIDVLDAVGGHLKVDSRAGQVMRIRPAEYDAVNEEWCTDAARYSYDSLSRNRLTTPILNGQPTGWPEVFAALKTSLSLNLPLVQGTNSTVAGIIDDMHTAEDIFAFKTFMQQVLGSNHLDCRSDQSGITSARCYTPFKQWETADAILLIGCNPRLEAPLLNIRLRRAVLKNKAVMASIGSPADLTYPVEHLGEKGTLLDKLTDGSHPFAKILKKAQRPLIIVGNEALTRPDAGAIIASASELSKRKDWQGLNILAPTVGRITALEVGAIPEGRKAMDTEAILEAWRSGELSALILYGEGAITPQHLKRRSQKGKLIYIGTHHTELAQLAHIVLPAAAWSEKSGLTINAEGRVQESLPATPPPLNAKEDWKIFRALSAELNQPLPFDNLAQLRSALGKAHPVFAAENRNTILPRKFTLPEKLGRLSAQVFVPAVSQYYLRTPYHYQSANMHFMQDEVGKAKIKKDAA